MFLIEKETSSSVHSRTIFSTLVLSNYEKLIINAFQILRFPTMKDYNWHQQYLEIILSSSSNARNEHCHLRHLQSQVCLWECSQARIHLWVYSRDYFVSSGHLLSLSRSPAWQDYCIFYIEQKWASTYLQHYQTIFGYAVCCPASFFPAVVCRE